MLVTQTTSNKGVILLLQNSQYTFANLLAQLNRERSENLHTHVLLQIKILPFFYGVQILDMSLII